MLPLWENNILSEVDATIAVKTLSPRISAKGWLSPSIAWELGGRQIFLFLPLPPPDNHVAMCIEEGRGR